MMIVLIFVLRFTRPEQLVNPTVLHRWSSIWNALKTPSSPVLPTTWITDAILAALKNDRATALLNAGLVFTFACMLVFISSMLARNMYFPGFSKSQMTPRRLLRLCGTKDSPGKTLLNFLPRESKAFAVKEIRTFFRDPPSGRNFSDDGADCDLHLQFFRTAAGVIRLKHLSAETCFLF
jgi:hypothetical protein